MANCTNPAIYRYTWPGQPEKRICFEHAVQILELARIMGFFLEMKQLTAKEMMDDFQCHQIVSESKESDG